MFIKDRFFSFTSMAYPGDTFAVATFDIREALSELFEIELVLVSRENEIDFDEVLESPANCIIHQDGKNLTLFAIVREFEQLHRHKGHVCYRALLAPKLWWLTLVRQNRVFLDKTVPEILRQTLLDAGLTERDFEFRLENQYQPRELVCQYNESSYHFFRRWCEREGLYYFFERLQDATRVVVTDTHIAHKELKSYPEVRYAPLSGLEEPDQPAVRSLVCRQRLAPAAVMRRDRHSQTPELLIESSQDVPHAGRGMDYLWGDAIRTPAEAKRLATQQAQAHKAQSARFHGESTVPSMRSGFLFSLDGHYRDDFNQDYLVLECQHHGNQLDALDPDIQKGLQGLVRQDESYRNTFTCMPASLQFRLPETLDKPRIRGVLPATIDAAGSGEYAELDEQGRYKVILPFDLSGRTGGTASSWLRMMQPYAGERHGMHFPLHKGAEVLLAFVDGDPDRPLIAGAVPNPLTPSPVTRTNQTACAITTSGQNRLHFQDMKGQESVHLASPHKNSWIRLGAPAPHENAAGQFPATSDKDTDSDDSDESNITINVYSKSDTKHWKHQDDTGGFRFYTEGDVDGNVANHMKVSVGGNLTNVIVGGEEHLTAGFFNRTNVGLSTYLHLGGRISVLEGREVILSNSTRLAVRGDFNIAFNMGLNVVVDNVLTVKHKAKALKVGDERVDLQDMENRLNKLYTRLSKEESTVSDTASSLSRNSSTMAMNVDAIASTENRMSRENTTVGESLITVTSQDVRMADSETRVTETTNRVNEQTNNITDQTVYL